jgi:two-component system, chemotaxis family, chemotaxis protein CheY
LVWLSDCFSDSLEAYFEGIRPLAGKMPRWESKMEAKNVLLVDDDADLREMIASKLEGHGLSVTQAANGQEALDKLDGNMPAVIILDMNMPVMDGWEFAKRFYRRSEIAPIIVLTAEKRARQGALEIGTKYSLGKPVDMNRLLSLVEDLTTKH